eukprot:g3639.t1
MSQITRKYPLGGNGVIVNLLHYLWLRDDDSAAPKVHVPDTVVFNFGQPAHWYFTSKDGTIKKKNRHNLTGEKILEVFVKKRSPGCDIIAYFLSQSESATGTIGSSSKSLDVVVRESLETSKKEEGEEGGDATTIEYFDEDGLRTFLKNGHTPNGVLQRFMQPKGNRNAMLRSVWSPTVCLLERRVNIRKLFDTRFDMYERAATFEGAEVNSKTTAVRGHYLPTKVQLLNESIVRHVAEVSFHKCRINRMVLNFKVDARDRLWLLWCSSLRLEYSPNSGAATKKSSDRQQSPVRIDMNVRVPKNVSLKSANGFKKPLNLRRTFKCPSCLALVGPERCHEVRYKVVITQFEQVLYDHLSSSAAFDRTSTRRGEDGGATQKYGLFEKPTKTLSTLEAHAKRIGLSGGALADMVRHFAQRHENSAGYDATIVPPVIRSLHPKLLMEDYLRYRRDPLFLFKNARVCEDCYLGYMDVASIDIETPLLMPSDPLRVERPEPTVADLRIAHASRAKREKARSHLETLRARARERRAAETARKMGKVVAFQKNPRGSSSSSSSSLGGDGNTKTSSAVAHLEPLRSKGKSARNADGSVTLMPFERELGHPPELGSFERLTPRRVVSMQPSDDEDSDDSEDLEGSRPSARNRGSGPLAHMRRRMKAVESAPRKLPALSSTAPASSSPSSTSMGPYRAAPRMVVHKKGGGHRTVAITSMTTRRKDASAAYSAARSRLLSKLSYRDWKLKQQEKGAIDGDGHSNLPESKDARDHR